VEVVLTRTAAAIIISREDFEILAYASWSPKASDSVTNLPTWAPNWAERRGDSTIRSQFQRDRIRPWRSLRKLSGIDSRVAELAIADLDWDAVIDFPQDWINHPTSKPFITVRAHCIAMIDSTTRQGDSKVLPWQDCQDFAHGLHMLLDNVLSFGEIDSRALPVRYKWLFDRSYSRPSFGRGQLESDAFLRGSSTKFDRIDVRRFCSKLYSLGQNNFIFRAGFLPATTSHDFKEGDTVWAVDGCTVPLILRDMITATPGNTDAKSYKIVGNCNLLTMSHLDCWVTSGTGLEQRWDFDPFRYMHALGTQMIRAY
jgi:hypothetical protein